MSETQITSTYPDTVAERRKWLIAQIDATYDRLMNELRQRYGKTTPPDCEVQLVHVRCLEVTMPYHDELTRIENFSIRHYTVAE